MVLKQRLPAEKTSIPIPQKSPNKKPVHSLRKQETTTTIGTNKIGVAVPIVKERPGVFCKIKSKKQVRPSVQYSETEYLSALSIICGLFPRFLA
jgi:hypothetical protein